MSLPQQCGDWDSGNSGDHFGLLLHERPIGSGTGKGEAIALQVVLVKSPKMLRGILRLLFGIKKPQAQ